MLLQPHLHTTLQEMLGHRDAGLVRAGVPTCSRNAIVPCPEVFAGSLTEQRSAPTVQYQD